MGVNRMPKPRIATGSGPSVSKGSKGMGGYKGQSGTKTPTGGRPVPRVAATSTPKSSSTGGGRRAVKPTPMKDKPRGSTAHRVR